MLSIERHVSEVGVSRLASPALHMVFLTFSKSGLPIYVLSHEIKPPIFSKLGFQLTISLILNYVPTQDPRLVDPPRYLCRNDNTLGKC